jgi:DNA-binding transcriptional regulator WhiA
VKVLNPDKKLLAYIIGLALGDGNLSNPNGRSVRLRITCDNKYPILIKEIKKSIELLLPQNKVSIVKKKSNSVDVSCYSNHWEGILGWRAKGGSKYKQQVHIPNWIKDSPEFSRACIRGLVQTDSSIFKDRKYVHLNIVSQIETLAEDIFEVISKLGYTPNIQIYKTIKNSIKYTIRISKNSSQFIDELGIWKE